jgi:hypothetical protein
MSSMDRTTRGLLTLLVIGIWGLLLRPFFVASPVVAQAPQEPRGRSQTAITFKDNFLYLYKDSKIYVYGFDNFLKRQKILIDKKFMSAGSLPARQARLASHLRSSYSETIIAW